MPGESMDNRFMLILRGGKSIRTLSPAEYGQMLQKYLNWVDELRKSGRYEAGEPLEEEGKTLSGSSGAMITDGPFAESKETVGGYFILTASTQDEAVQVARGCPIFDTGGTVEVRRIAKVPTASSSSAEAC